ncbi:hypothetical protein [Streptomyces sp. NPDC014656]|uniref:hypothetical protein n=1 Tax=Streptomyces sp. NPDC014656 TaxID=3364878 RepID=UPI0036F70C48
MAGLLNPLEARGIIRCERSAVDCRAIQVVLTDRGRERTEEARERWRQRWRQAMADVPAEELQVAIQVLGKAAGLYGRP